MPEAVLEVLRSIIGVLVGTGAIHPSVAADLHAKLDPPEEAEQAPAEAEQPEQDGDPRHLVGQDLNGPAGA
jgi:hypothetical protein